jgi:hypothetical protein
MTRLGTLWKARNDLAARPSHGSKFVHRGVVVLKCPFEDVFSTGLLKGLELARQDVMRRE